MMLRYRSTAISITFNLVVASVLATAAASAQDINTIAGTGARRFGGPAVAADLNFPGEIAIAPDGTIFFADIGNLRIRRIRPSGIIG